MFEPILPTTRAVPVDEGFLDFAGYLSALERNGFKGAVTYEMCSPLRGGGSVENLDLYARRFVEFPNKRREVHAM
jgi:sugar phosphate isomerase/epimerase